MTKEELKQEAGEKLSKVELDYCHGFMNPCEPNELPYIELVRFRTGFERGYIAGAEPREKQLDEFRKENAELKAKIYGGGYDAVIAKKDADIILLEKQNSELKKWKEDTIKARGNDYMAWSRQNDQLTKAKFLLKQLVDAFPKSYSDVVKDTLKEAKKFGEE